MGTIDLNHLATFVVVAEKGGFSSAAAVLGQPKSSVSRAVSQLEAQLGVRLLHRSTRKVALSTSGAAFLARIRPQLDALRAATEELPERQAEPSGKLRVTTVTDLGGAFLADVAARFVARYPAVQLELVMGERMVDLIAERVDAALRIAIQPLRDSSLVARRVGRVHLQLYTSPAYLARRKAPRHARELVDHPWATLLGVPPVWLEGPGGGAWTPKDPALSCTDGVSLRACLRAGGGIGLLPSFLVADDLARGDLVRVLPSWSLRAGDLWFVTPGGRQAPAKVTAFREMVTEALASHPQLALDGGGEVRPRYRGSRARRRA